MKKFTFLITTGLLALFLAIMPVKVQVSQTNNAAVSIPIEVVEKVAEAGKSRSSRSRTKVSSKYGIG